MIKMIKYKYFNQRIYNYKEKKIYLIEHIKNYKKNMKEKDNLHNNLNKIKENQKENQIKKNKQ